MLRSAVAATERLHGLDAYRAAATVLVVLLHAGVPYAATPMPGLTWPVQHTDPSRFVDGVFWALACCVMPAFFWLSGYVAAHSLTQRGSRAFWSSRWQRIGQPLLIFAAILLPLELYIWLTGWALDGQIAWRKLSSLKLGPYHDNLWGLSHLWYLEYLLLYCGLLHAWKALVSRIGHGGTRGLVPPDHLLFSGVVLAAAVVLWWSPETLVGFQHSFFPVPAKFAFCGLYFAIGAVCQAWRAASNNNAISVALPQLDSRRSVCRGTACCVVGGAVFALAFPLLTRQAVNPLTGTDRWLLAALLAGFATLMPAGMWQLAAAQTTAPSRTVRFVAAASYWTYLVHHPLVALCHIALRPTGWPAAAQFLLTAAVTLIVCGLSFAGLVQGTALGTLLGELRALPADSQRLPSRRAA